MAASGSSNGALAAFERNNYFYGLLMDESRFNKQELYFNQKRWLLNRRVLGSGVVCGLDVTADLQKPGMMFISPGVAIDGFGREIIVPTQVPVNPVKLTDDQGNPAGDAQAGVTVICLAYAESLVDPVPVLVPDCDHPCNCACSTVREQFRTLVRQADPNQPEPKPPACTLGEFPLPVDGALQQSLSQRISAVCPSLPADPCVALAYVDVATQTIKARMGRPLVYNNPLLYELILCLSARVNQLAQVRILRYVSGDAQSATKNTKLPHDLVVELVDWSGNQIQNPVLHFEAVGDHVGSLAPTVVQADGVHASWTLADALGVQEVIAKADGSPFIVKFNAKATE
jgi:hypothetical protein